MRYTALLLIALSGACEEFQGPNTQWIATAVSPTTLRAGDTFTASATATFGNCREGGQISVSYEGQGAVTMSGGLFQWRFMALLGQTVVQFDAKCRPEPGVWGESPFAQAPTRHAYITVAP